MDINSYKDLLFSNSGSKKCYQFKNDDCTFNNNLLTNNLIKVVLLSKVNYENGAGGTRVSNLVKLFNHSKRFYTSSYVFTDNYDDNVVFEETPFSRCVSLGNYEKEKSKIKKYRKLFYNKKKIKNILEEEKPTLVLVYSVLTFRNISFLKKYCRKKNIKLIYDVVEYRKLTSSFSPFAFFGYNLHNNLISSRFINKNTDGVICPTYFLKNHFENKRMVHNILLFPITMDVSNMPKYSKTDKIDKIVYLYAGMPHKKRDLLVNMIMAFNRLSKEEKERIILVICGIGSEKLISEEKLPIDEYNKSLEFTLYLGSIPKSKVMDMLPNIDYTILLKNPKKRFSKAGFPTKMAESFSCAVPMIANLSGDMGYYMKDMENGLICSTESIDDFLIQLKQSISIYQNKHSALSEGALKTAKEQLDNSCYYDAFEIFIDEAFKK